MKKLVALVSAGVFGLATVGAHATSIVLPGSDRDAHGCIPSAGYMWSESEQACVRPWEQKGADVVTWAYNNGITKFDTVDAFNGNVAITREQAAKMFMSRLYSKNLPIAMPAIYCVFEDEATIDSTLKASVNDVCALGLLKGYKGKFMPKEFIGTDAIKTLATRVIAMMPELKTIVDQAVTLLPEGKLVSRMDFITALQYADGIVSTHIEDQKTAVLADHQAKLDAAKALWAKAAKTSYTLQQTRSCFCGPDSTRPISFDVVNGTIQTGSVAYADASGGKLTDEMLSRGGLYTVNAAFDYIQEAINERADHITVEYDATSGYPKNIYVDRSHMIADEELGLTFVMTK